MVQVGGSLVMTSLTSRDSGEYTCLSNNSVGSLTITSTLIVTSPLSGFCVPSYETYADWITDSSKLIPLSRLHLFLFKILINKYNFFSIQKAGSRSHLFSMQRLSHNLFTIQYKIQYLVVQQHIRLYYNVGSNGAAGSNIMHCSMYYQ